MELVVSNFELVVARGAGPVAAAETRPLRRTRRVPNADDDDDDDGGGGAEGSTGVFRLASNPADCSSVFCAPSLIYLPSPSRALYSPGQTCHAHGVCKDDLNPRF